jgi:hypothetical protein
MLRGNAPHSSARRSVRRAAVMGAALAVTSVLSGCVSAAPAAPPSPSPTVEASAGAEVGPQEVCAQLIDINTLIYNEKTALDQGRIADVEYQSVNRLAGRMVHRVDVTAEADLARAVDELREVVGPYKPGAMTGFDPASEEWTDAFSAAKDECTRVGVEFYVEGWTGG